MSLYPMINDSPAPGAEPALPLAREIARDPLTGKTIWQEGAPVIVTGLQAVQSWAYAALATVRCRHPIYDATFGCEATSLIGRRYSQDVKQVEAARMVRDALQLSPYVTDVRDVEVDFSGSALSISCTMETIYGEAVINERL